MFGKFGKDVSEIIVYCGICGVGLRLYRNVKKPRLLRKNVKVLLGFAQKYQYWIIDNWSHVVVFEWI